MRLLSKHSVTVTIVRFPEMIAYVRYTISIPGVTDANFNGIPCTPSRSADTSQNYAVVGLAQRQYLLFEDHELPKMELALITKIVMA